MEHVLRNRTLAARGTNPAGFEWRRTPSERRDFPVKDAQFSPSPCLALAEPGWTMPASRCHTGLHHRRLATTVRTAAIIAGGEGRRLGGLDKSALVIDGQRILQRQLGVVGQVAEHVLIVSNDHHRFRASGVRVCADLTPGAGPLGGVYTALVRSPTAQTLVIAGDLPFLTARFLRYLTDHADTVGAVVPWNAHGPQPLCAVYDRGCCEPIHARLERRDFRLSDFVETQSVARLGASRVAPFDPDGRLFFNVNTPDDHTRACRLARKNRA